MTPELRNYIAMYVQRVGHDTAEKTAIAAIASSLYDMTHMIVETDNIFLGMVQFQVEVLKYLRGDEDRVNHLCMEFAKEAAL